MDVILRLKGVKKEEIVKINYEDGQVVVYTANKKYFYTVEMKRGAYIIVNKETKIVQSECRPVKQPR